jgi:hypothetical protein
MISNSIAIDLQQIEKSYQSGDTITKVLQQIVKSPNRKKLRHYRQIGFWQIL